MVGKRVIVLVSALLLLAACAANHSAVESVRARDSYTGHAVRDSVFVCDSVRVAQRADTVFFDRVRMVYRDRLRVDTAYVRDTVYCEKSIVKERVVKRSFIGWRHGLLLFLLVLLCVAGRRLLNVLK